MVDGKKDLKKTTAEDKPTGQVKAVVKTRAKTKVDYYELRLWAGTKTVFRCVSCDHFLEKEDDMITHVLRHVPESEQNDVLELLTKR